MDVVSCPQHGILQEAAPRGAGDSTDIPARKAGAVHQQVGEAEALSSPSSISVLDYPYCVVHELPELTAESLVSALQDTHGPASLLVVKSFPCWGQSRGGL